MFAPNNKHDDSGGFYEQLLAHLPNGVVVLTPVREPGGRITNFTFAFTTRRRTTVGLPNGRPWRAKPARHFSRPRRKDIIGQYAKVVESGRSQTLEYEYVREGRRRRWVPRQRRAVRRRAHHLVRRHQHLKRTELDCGRTSTRAVHYRGHARNHYVYDC
jgi:hypothetical protein